MRRIFCLIVVFAISLISAFAQKTETNSSDVRLVKNLPNVYISFERVGKRKPLHAGESDNGVWLRLHNNSKWQVGFCQWDVTKEYGDKDLDYEVEKYKDVKGWASATMATNPEGSCPIISIASGKSVLFSVPREHLVEGLAIKVPFRYEWETDSDGFTSDLEPKHFVYFYSDDIPKK